MPLLKKIFYAGHEIFVFRASSFLDLKLIGHMKVHVHRMSGKVKQIGMIRAENRAGKTADFLDYSHAFGPVAAAGKMMARIIAAKNKMKQNQHERYPAVL